MISLAAAAAPVLAAIIVVVPGPAPEPGTTTTPGTQAQSSATPATTGTPTNATTPSSAVTGGTTVARTAVAAPSLSSCTKQVATPDALSQALSSAAGGDRICVTADLASTRLTVTKGGPSPAQPVTVVGNGKTVVKGITVKASNVTVDGFQVVGASAPGIEISGKYITVQNNTVKHPTGGDFDGLRFFGDNLKILHNTITDINPGGGGAHADCMQTFTSGGGPPTSHLLVDGNRCDNIDNQCIMAEGPGDVGDGGGGPGKSEDWTITNNYCRFSAGQALMFEAIQNAKIRDNEFVGKADKAIGLDINSTGAKVGGNKLVGVKADVGMSENSKQGYQGPDPQGGP
ncbi:right-handed parallel beta-helix repeat-containing protein [Pseudonocardia spinosispora]|uniref:right-handed parallel beta-helix repeat-containing protein n=1 Tax=Pseudonocardia spinosispora TaxID=103441 RepID=UPI0004131911|nr:right-handed parallel beta-helix repeat-containing protein [Pseudonocardia spinosispora]